MAETRVIVEVAPGLNQWAWSDPDEALILPAGGRITLKGADAPGPDALAAIGAAVAAGSLILVEADTETRKTIEAAAEKDDVSLKLLGRADEIRAELLADRDETLDALARSRSSVEPGGNDDAKDEAAAYLAKRDQILAEHADRVDAEIRGRLGGDE